MRTAVLRTSGKSLSNTLSYLFFPSHILFLMQMCCFCQIPEIRSVCHLRVWSLKPPQQRLWLRFLFAALGNNNFCFTPNLMPLMVCHESDTEGFPYFLLVVKWTKGFRTWHASHVHLLLWGIPILQDGHTIRYNCDDGNSFISTHLCYLALKEFSYDLDTESVPAEFKSRTPIDFNKYTRLFLISTVTTYSWHNNWWPSILRSL